MACLCFNTVGAQIPNMFIFRFVEYCSNDEWFRLCNAFENLIQISTNGHHLVFYIALFFEWLGPFKNGTIPNLNFKFFRFWMCSGVECAVFKPPLYLLFWRFFSISTHFNLFNFPWKVILSRFLANLQLISLPHP